MLRSQRGGFLEPLQKTPPFKYTTNPERIAWTSMIYPYAPYFFNLFKEIPWAEFRYEDDEVVATTNMELGAYGIMGGCYFELINREYSRYYPSKDYSLHNFVDPTGDIDVELNGLIVESKIPGKEFNYYYEQKDSSNRTFERDYKKPYRFTKAYMNWLLDYIETYFKSLSYNFPEWFPNAITDYDLIEQKLKDTTENVEQFQYSDFTSLRRVGPLLISAEYLPDTPRIQVSMLHKGPDGSITLEHMIEMLCTGTPNGEEIVYTFHKLPTLELYVNEIRWEMFTNMVAATYRIEAPSNYYHKFLNHIYRALYWCWFCQVIKANPDIVDQLLESEEDIDWSIEKIFGEDGMSYIARRYANKNPQSIPYIVDFVQRLPEQIRIEYYKVNHEICESIKKTDEECGLLKPKNGGSRKTRKHKRHRKFRVASRRGRK